MWFFESLRNPNNFIVSPWNCVSKSSLRSLRDWMRPAFSLGNWVHCVSPIVTYSILCFIEFDASGSYLRWPTACDSNIVVFCLNRFHYMVVCNSNVVWFCLNRCHCTIIFNSNVAGFLLNRCHYTIVCISKGSISFRLFARWFLLKYVRILPWFLFEGGNGSYHVHQLFTCLKEFYDINFLFDLVDFSLTHHGSPPPWLFLNSYPKRGGAHAPTLYPVVCFLRKGETWVSYLFIW